MCQDIAQETGLRQVALSGGVFQNRLLLRLTRRQLEKAGFQVFTHHLVPTNDGGIALGQAVVAQFMK
jgi:hydrogenase maturation protein HypF